jgi:4-amino-4-deoxy-L-arabinose transferase-like glycosyltransferase
MRARDMAGLSALWLVATGYNLCKPYHIDDTAHLIIAGWIAQHPWHPMRGPLNWSGTAAPIFATNQPHLYFYAAALWAWAFGFGEVAMHALQACFAGACILIFHRIARRLAPADALWLTAMLALNPAFIVEQNLMVDVPLLACWLAFFEALLCRADAPAQAGRFAQAGLACAAAVLVKYSSLLLLPILLAALLRERRGRYGWCLGIPLGALAAWSAFNWLDVREIHLATAFHSAAATYTPRPARHFELARRLVKSAIAWGVAVGALSPFGVIALARAWPGRAGAIYALCGGGLVVLALAVASGLLADRWADKLLWLGFALNALALLALRPQAGPARAYLLLWVAFTSLFYLLFSPFIAARHVLLILPALSLLTAPPGGLPRGAKIFGLGCTLLLAAGLCLSDFRFAAFYRAQAAAIPASLPPRATIWAAGHWGWQYYATRAGMRELDVKNSHLAPGDILVVPREVDHQLPPHVHLAWQRTITGNFSRFDPFCTGRPGRFYLSYTFRGPWSLSTDCTQHIDLFTVLAN